MIEPASPPVTVLRIPKIRLEVAVLRGTDDFTLNRAVGHIDGTALPETEGNSGIARCSVREWEARAHSRATGAPP